MGTFVLVLSAMAWAGEAEPPAPRIWLGGQTGALMGWQAGDRGGAVGQVGAELDLRVGWKKAMFRLDLDLNLDPFTGESVYNPLPEWAMLQVGNERARGRFGIFSPNIGLEDWDRWNNYLPTWSLNNTFATPGRFLGAEVAGTLGDFELFGSIGADLDYADLPTFAVALGISGERDTWATWSGIVAYPTDGFFGAYLAFDFYPLDQLWLSYDGGVGLSGTAPWWTNQVVVNILPEAVVQPVVRGEYIFDPGGEALGGAEEGVAMGAVSVGLRSQPLEMMSIMVEAKGVFWEDSFSPGVHVSLDFLRPEPGMYEAPDPRAPDL